jgi:hypothetical protein
VNAFNFDPTDTIHVDAAEDGAKIRFDRNLSDSYRLLTVEDIRSRTIGTTGTSPSGSMRTLSYTILPEKTMMIERPGEGT